MGLAAEVMAWGPYSDEIADYLEYPREFYHRTAPGTVVISAPLLHMPTTSLSKELALCLGISDAWDFNQHKIDPERINVPGLRVLFEKLAQDYCEQCYKDLNALLTLRLHGFQLMFRPNG